MGLSMYLSKRTYVKNWSHMQPDELHQVLVKKGGEPVPRTEIDPAKISYIEQEIGCWRTANAIHQWFVDNCADGVDDCRPVSVDAEQLKELLRTVESVLGASTLVEGETTNGYACKDGKEEPIVVDGKYIADATVAKELLPTQEGCFFGSTDYDEYYYSDLLDTKQILEDALQDPNADFEYCASW